jgi:hypothetical protein
MIDEIDRICAITCTVESKASQRWADVQKGISRSDESLSKGLTNNDFTVCFRPHKTTDRRSSPSGIPMGEKTQIVI